MPTQNIVLTRTPQQITDGTTETLFMQSLNGRDFAFVVSDSTPSASLKPHTTRDLNLNGAVKVWAWSIATTDIPIVITKF